MRLILFALLCVFASPAAAQDYKTLLDLPEGVSLVSLSASERVEIEQDLLVATLRYQFEGEDARGVQDEINKKMKKALDKAKKISSVKASTQQYYVHEYDKNRGKKHLKPLMIWKGQQGLMIKGKKADDLLELVGEIQDLGFQMSGLNYQVSPELLEQTRDSLLEKALVKLKTKAERTAKAIGKSKSELKEIRVDMGGNYYPQARMARMEMAMDSAPKAMSAPVAAPGESQVTLTVNAQALLK